jgi:tetratricopeptide (TPR) repeat protein
MSDPTRSQRQHCLREAEGYLDLITVFDDRWPPRPDMRLSLAQRAIESLERISSPGGHQGRVCFLRGYALRLMDRYADAVVSLREAADLEPQDVSARLSLGWCYKRMRRLDLAIEALEEALAIEPSQAIIHYNLACYWSLAGNVKLCVAYLSQAFDLDPNYRDHVPREHDFDNVRKHPHFQALTTVIV